MVGLSEDVAEMFSRLSVFWGLTGFSVIDTERDTSEYDRVRYACNRSERREHASTYYAQNVEQIASRRKANDTAERRAAACARAKASYLRRKQRAAA